MENRKKITFVRKGKEYFYFEDEMVLIHSSTQEIEPSLPLHHAGVIPSSTLSLLPPLAEMIEPLNIR